MTIGVNLDAQLRPKEAGVLSINPEQFRSGDMIEKILRLNFKDDEYTCIAKLVPFNKNQNENQKTALSIAFNSAINDVYSSSLRSWKKIVQQYVLENTDFLLNLIPEIEFLVKGTRLLSRLKAKGCPLCVPEVMPAADRCVHTDFTIPPWRLRSRARSSPTTLFLMRMPRYMFFPDQTAAENPSLPARSVFLRQ